MKARWPIFVIVVVQSLCAMFFVSQILASVLGVPPYDWRVYELIEIGAAFGLILGLIVGAVVLRNTLRQNSDMHDQLRLASGAFMEVLEERFVDWDLTAAERDVALFAIKGLSTTEIAQLRSVSEGTVKAQTNAIYKKAGVSGRPQLLSLFIDDLLVLAS